MINEYDAFFSAFYSSIEELVKSNTFRYFSLFVVVLITISMTCSMLRFFSYYSPAAKKDEKQVFTEKDIS